MGASSWDMDTYRKARAHGALLREEMALWR